MFSGRLFQTCGAECRKARASFLDGITYSFRVSVSVCLFVTLSLCLYVCLFVCLSLCLSDCLSVCRRIDLGELSCELLFFRRFGVVDSSNKSNVWTMMWTELPTSSSMPSKRRRRLSCYPFCRKQGEIIALTQFLWCWLPRSSVCDKPADPRGPSSLSSSPSPYCSPSLLSCILLSSTKRTLAWMCAQ